MKSYTSTEARQNFAALLEQARSEGAVRIRRRDGQAFIPSPEAPKGSPLDIEPVNLEKPLTLDDIVAAVREGRER